MAEWRTLSQAPIGGRLQSVVDSTADILGTLADALQVLVVALAVLKGLSFASVNIIKSIVEAIITLIEELLHDLLEFNVAMALHVNLNWNPFWVYNKEKERDPRTGKLDPRLVDYEADGQFPWAGTGLVGWLLDLLASSKDPTNPFRPVTDSNTHVYGVMLVKGISNPADAERSLGLEDWYRLFTNWKGFEVDFGKVSAAEHFDSLQKLGTTALMNTFASLYQLGPKDRQLLPVQAFVQQNANLAAFYPSPGSYPKWVSAPMASAVPPLRGAIEDLRKVVGLLRFSDDTGDTLSNLIDALNAKVDVLTEGLEQVQEAIAFAISLAGFLTDAYVLVHEVPAGGMDLYIAEALTAEDAPDFGTAGIVVGVTFLATQPEAQASIDKFLEILGVQTRAYVSTTTAYDNALNDTFEELFPPDP